MIRLILKGDNIELSAKALGLTVEASNGVRVVEPFDTFFKFSKVAGKASIHVAISYMLRNFSYRILQLFIRLQEDILAFLNTTSRRETVVCSQFNRIWADESISFNKKYSFWRPQAPPRFAVLGHCLTPMNEPPSKGVLALNTSFAKVKSPLHFELVWSSSEYKYCSDRQQIKPSESDIRETDVSQYSHHNPEQSECRVWMPIPPEGYVALGCVVSRGREQPSLSSSLCVSATLVTPCPLKDCVLFSYPQLNAHLRIVFSSAIHN
jgi:vacuolar protein sorting-associated protein 13A/C